MKKYITMAGVAFLFLGNYALAMSSTNYQINADSINSGGNLSNSANYKSFDSIGETFIGAISSTNFTIGEGLAPMLSYSITLVLDSSTKNLGSVTPGIPISGTTTATVTTDAWGGYDLYIAQNNNLKHTDTVTTIASFSPGTIAVPTAWAGTGFGFTVSGGTSVEAKYNGGLAYASIPTTSTLFHTKAGFKSGGDNTVVGYKLDVPATQKSGTYSNILTYVAITKL